MQRCPDCSRHVWERESRCPFCSGVLSYAHGPAPVMFAALVGLAIFGCNGDGDDTTGSTTDATIGTDSMSSTVGVSTTSVSEPTTSSDPTTSDGSATTTTASDSTTTTTTTTTTEETTTSTSDATTTSTTTTEGTSTTTSDTDSTSTGDTTGETESTTLMTTTGGECMERGEELCGDLCVNTQFNDDHCGECFSPCNQDEGEGCLEGECMVVILPYGAPMPEPLWI